MVENTITLGGLATLLAIIVGVVGLLFQQRKMRRENEADGRARAEEIKDEFRVANLSIKDRLGKVETRIADFVPRVEFEAKIEHEKGNRMQADESLRRITDNLSRDVRDIMIGQSKIEQQQADTAGNVTEIKDTLKELGRDLASRFDKVSKEISDLTVGHRRAGEVNH